MSPALTTIHDVPLVCSSCRRPITSTRHLVSKDFRGHKGKAALYTHVSNVALGPSSILLMDTGAHTIREFSCMQCASYLGWMIVRAHEAPERWKEGHYLLELALLQEEAELPPPQPQSRPPPRPIDISRAVVQMALGHRRTATDPHAARGRPLGPRSLTPSMRSRERTLSQAY